MTDYGFTESEENSVKEYMTDLSDLHKNNIKYSLGLIVSKWELFVRRVENGYPSDSFDDYTNDLCLRNLLSDILQISNTPLKEKLDVVIAPIDQRFNNATVEIEHPILGSPLKSDEPWWFRIPKKRNKSLQKAFAPFMAER